MYKGYWNLFWSTGMPQAWLMSRDRDGRSAAAPGPDAGEGRGLPGPLVDFQPRLTDNMPGDPRGIV